MLTDSSANPPENWQNPLRLSGFQSIGDDLAIDLATASDGTVRGIVLMRKVPAKP